MIDCFISLHDVHLLFCCLFYFCFNIVVPYGVIFCSYSKRFSLPFYFLALSQSSLWEFVSLTLEISIQLFFFSFLPPSYWSLCCLSCFWSLWLVSLWSFLCSLRIVSMHPCCLRSRQVHFLILFLTYIVCLCHLSDVRPYAWLLVFLLSGPFAEVLPSSTSRIVPSILQRRQRRSLFLSFWFWVVFPFSRDTLFKFFLSSPLVW